MNSLVKMLARLALGRSYVFRPMASRYRHKQIIKCPESGQPAQILVEALPSATSRPRKKPLSIRNCSLWPAKKDCTQSCIK